MKWLKGQARVYRYFSNQNGTVIKKVHTCPSTPDRAAVLFIGHHYSHGYSADVGTQTSMRRSALASSTPSILKVPRQAVRTGHCAEFALSRGSGRGCLRWLTPYYAVAGSGASGARLVPARNIHAPSSTLSSFRRDSVDKPPPREQLLGSQAPYAHGCISR